MTAAQRRVLEAMAEGRSWSAAVQHIREHSGNRLGKPTGRTLATLIALGYIGHERVLGPAVKRLLDALDAADALAGALEKIAEHWNACEECQDEGCCEAIAMSDLWRNRDAALAAYRALVEPS